MSRVQQRSPWAGAPGVCESCSHKRKGLSSSPRPVQTPGNSPWEAGGILGCAKWKGLSQRWKPAAVPAWAPCVAWPSHLPVAFSTHLWERSSQGPLFVQWPWLPGIRRASSLQFQPHDASLRHLVFLEGSDRCRMTTNHPLGTRLTAGEKNQLQTLPSKLRHTP